MRVLITGASGMVGSHVADALLARGDEVVGLSRDPERARATNPTVTWHAWQPATERPPAEAFVSVDAVVNSVGEEVNQRLTPQAKERIRDSRVRATKNLVDGMTAATNGPKVLVSQSAVGYYGDRGQAMLDESVAPGDGFLAELPVEWEAAARQAEEAGVRVVVLRSAPVLNKETGLLKQLLLPFRLGVGGPLAGGDWYLPWIHRDDEIGMFLWALDNPRVTGAVNAAAPNPVTNREFSKALGRALGRPAVLPAPKLAVRLMRGEELAAGVTASLRVVPRRALDLGYQFRWPDLEPALRDLVGS